jgi:trk system potassium uptake protein
MFNKNTKNIIIIGAGRLGVNLAKALSKKGFYITIIDKDENSFRFLPDNFSGYRLNGDGTEPEVLTMADISNAQTVIVCTGNDNVNCLAAQIASKIFGIKNVYVRLYDSEKEKLLNGLNIQVICPCKLSLIEFERLNSLQLEEVVRV